MRNRIISMLVTGLVLAVSLLLVFQLFQTLSDQNAAGEAASVQEELPQLVETVKPVLIYGVSETQNVLTVSGTAQANLPISAELSGQIVQQVNTDEDGNWSINIRMDDLRPVQVQIIQYIDDKTPVRSDETIYRIPPPELELGETENPPRALVMTAAPGGPSSIFQSPFGGLPTSGAISVGSIDYDESGGVIFSGSSDVQGKIRYFVNSTPVGESRVEANGRFYFRAADTLPLGTFDITYLLITEQEIHSRITIPFERLNFSDPQDPRPVQVAYNPYAWHIWRPLAGGGQQYTAVFAPMDADPIVPESP